MLVSHSKKFVFIKTSKTAGTSVEMYFEPYCLPDESTKITEDRDELICSAGIIGGRGNGVCDNLHSHMPAKSIKELITDKQWDQYLKFTIVRNPFDRLVSRYFFNRKVKDAINIGDWKRQYVINDFRLFAQDSYYPLLGQITLGPNLVVDKVIRYESLQEGIAEVCELLNVEFDATKIPHLKSGIRDKSFDIKALYDTATIRAVEEKYNREIDLFHYTFESLLE